MKIYLFSMLCLDENEYPDLNLYRHFIDYYKKLGIESDRFTIIPCGGNRYEKNLEEFQKINTANNIPNHNLISKKYDIFNANEILLKWQKKIDKEDWVLFPDPDEFNNYGGFDDILTCAKFLEENNYYALEGEFEDRVANDLILHKVQYPKNLFNQFPKKTNITKRIITASWKKILLSKAKVELRVGHHFVIWNSKKSRPAFLGEVQYRGDEYWKWPPVPASYVYQSNLKVCHFKWTESLIHRLQNPNKHKNLYSMFNKDREKTKSIITNNKFNIII
jgi:hypothetical protein